MKKNDLKTIVCAGAIFVGGLFLNSCSSKKYVVNSVPFEETNVKSNTLGEYKINILNENNENYVFRTDSLGIYGINFENTQTVKVLGRDTLEWEEKEFKFKPTLEKIYLETIKVSRRFKSDKKIKKIKERDYKYKLEKLANPIEINGIKYFEFKKGNKMYLAKENCFKELIDNERISDKKRKLYLQATKENGILVADTKNYSTKSEEKQSTKKSTWTPYPTGNGFKKNNQQIKCERYKVQPGDNLWNLATKYGTTVKKIKEINSKRSNTIHPGEILAIPKNKK